jgi:hypothetical protein
LLIERTVIAIFEITADDHYQVNKHPDAKTPEGKKLKDASDETPRVEAMHTESA